MLFWKEHMGLRAILMAVFFVSGMAMLVYGWLMHGELLGLGLMIVGLILVLAALMLYNKPFEDPKGPKKAKKSK